MWACSLIRVWVFFLVMYHINLTLGFTDLRKRRKVLSLLRAQCPGSLPEVCFVCDLAKASMQPVVCCGET